MGPFKQKRILKNHLHSCWDRCGSRHRERRLYQRNEDTGAEFDKGCRKSVVTLEPRRDRVHPNQDYKRLVHKLHTGQADILTLNRGLGTSTRIVGSSPPSHPILDFKIKSDSISMHHGPSRSSLFSFPSLASHHSHRFALLYVMQHVLAPESSYISFFKVSDWQNHIHLSVSSLNFTPFPEEFMTPCVIDTVQASILPSDSGECMREQAAFWSLRADMAAQI